MSEPQFGGIGAAVLKVLLSKFFLHLVESDHLDGVVQVKGGSASIQLQSLCLWPSGALCPHPCS